MVTVCRIAGALSLNRENARRRTLGHSTHEGEYPAAAVDGQFLIGGPKSLFHRQHAFAELMRGLIIAASLPNEMIPCGSLSDPIPRYPLRRRIIDAMWIDIARFDRGKPETSAKKRPGMQVSFSRV